MKELDPVLQLQKSEQENAARARLDWLQRIFAEYRKTHPERIMQHTTVFELERWLMEKHNGKI